MTEHEIPMGDGRWTYVAAGRPKPFIHPVLTPVGGCLTRVEPPDHEWHRALWFTIKYVNGDNFWEEEPPFGSVRHDGPPEADGRTLDGTLDWAAPDGSTVLRERRRLTHVALDEGAYAIDFDTTLEAVVDAVLDRTPFTTWGGYGGLALRGAGDWHDTRILLADGSEHRRVLGEPSPWCDLSGEVGHTGRPGGLAILDAPSNPRHPVAWYGASRSRVYGEDGWSNFLNAAFLFHEPLSLAAGEPLRLRYRVVVHDGEWDVPRVAAAFDDYAAGPGGG